MKKEIVIVGGVAAGMSCAAKLSRESKDVNITVFEKGEHISYGACGLPYYVGDVIKDHNKLIIRKPEDFNEKNLDIKIFHEVVETDYKKKEVKVLNIKNNEVFTKKYDSLVIATGAEPFKPDFIKEKMKNVYTLRDIQDGLNIKKSASDNSIKDVVIIGGGYIGLEMAEAFHLLGKNVRVINRSARIMKTFDDEIREILIKELESKNILLSLKHEVEEILLDDKGCVKGLRAGGETFPADLILVAIGVRPSTKVFQHSNLETLKNGAIITDDKMRTNIPGVYAAGDCATIRHKVLNKDVNIPLATYANRQGRILAEILAGEDVSFPGGIGASVIKVLDLALSQTGLNESQAKEASMSYHTSFVKAYSNAGYYPGSKPLYIKMIFEKDTNIILGAQMIGEKGAEHRINVFSLAIAKKMTLRELAYMDFAYTPAYSGSWDPIQVACNVALSKNES